MYSADVAGSTSWYRIREFRSFPEHCDLNCTNIKSQIQTVCFSQKGVQILKRTLEKTKETGQDYEMGLVNSRGSTSEKSLKNSLSYVKDPSTEKSDYFKQLNTHWKGKDVLDLQAGDVRIF